MYRMTYSLFFIVGVYTVGLGQSLDLPTHPAFSLNMFKDIALAYPSEEIDFIEVPAANNQGSAKTSYHIKVPPGRQGMQPDIFLSYDSEDGVGWCGMGWDLTFPAITIDTRWGVPRYYSTLESETYLIEGQQLAPVAHRDELVSREADKRFYLRVQSRYEKIIRHGNSPKNYWWEVASADGRIRYFGGDPEGGVDHDYTLRDDQNNIAQWAMKKVVDRHGNYMSYVYAHVQHPGVTGATTMGRAIYLKSMSYTAHETHEAPFHVTFIRDRELGETERVDVAVTARLGFKQVVGDRLRRIEVRMHDELVRAYELKYIQGAFHKSLLSDVICLDASNEEFYRHSMTYFDDVRIDGDYYPFADRERWNGQNDDINGGLAAANNTFPDDVSLLGGNYSSDWSLGGAATVGLIGDLLTKVNTVGANYNFGKSTGIGRVAFVDINGDGLPDKVYNKGSSLFYRANQYQNQGSEFGPERPIIGVSQFSNSSTTSHAVGAEAHPLGGFVGYSYNNITTNITTYFSDFNGDGLVDIVFNGIVYFNHIGVNGDPVFTQSSGDTPSAIKIGGAIDDDLIVVDPDEQERLIDESPLHDIVRMWEAPYDGAIRISGAVRLLDDPSIESQSYQYKDGVRVAVQVREDEQWSAEIAANDFAPKTPTGVNNISVSAGDRIYFRVQSINNGAYDQVQWDPRIEYRNESTTALEPTTKPFHVFQASDDFLLASSQTVTMPLDGVIDVSGPFIKPVLSDHIFVQIIREDLDGNQNVVDAASYASTSDVNTDLSFTNIVVDSGDVFYFRINCQTNVDWSAVTWRPRVAYKSADNGTVVIGANNEPLVTFCPSPEFQMYSKVFEKTRVYVVPETGTMRLEERLGFFLGSGTLTLSVKKEKELLGTAFVSVVTGIVSQGAPIEINVTEGDRLFIEFHTNSYELASTLLNSRVKVELNSIDETIDVGFHSQRSDEDVIFGPMFRNWGLFAYNGNRDRAFDPINEDELEISEDAADAADGAGDIDNPDDIGSTYSNASEPFILLVADVKNNYWIGSDDLTYIASDTMSSSRMGEDNVLPLTFDNSSGLLIMPPIRSISRVHSVAGGASVGPVGPGGSVAFNTTKNEIDVLDMNGDGYPDIVTDAGFQYTTMCGGLEETFRPHNYRHHEASSFAWGISANVDFVHSSATNAGDASQGGSSANKRGGVKTKGSKKVKNASKSRRGAKAKSTVNKSSKKSKDSSRASQNGIGIDAGFTTDRDTTQRSWIDINGDGLLDMVFNNGTAALNLGYSFTAPEPWGHSSIRNGISKDYGGGLGVNLFSGSIVSGVSINRTDNEMETSLQDVNGDGMVDLITNIDPLRVRLNTGNGFAEEVVWHGGNYIENGSATGESVNAAFTVCVPIIILGIKICVNPSSSIGRGVSRVTQQLADADGDGFVDYLESDQDNELYVRRSTIGRTNLLKSIERPLGGEIEIDYALAGNTYGLPYSRWVMAQVTAHDGVSGDGADESKVAITYENGNYDRHEREFYGFGDVRVYELDTENNNAVYRINHFSYANSNYYNKGLQSSFEITDAVGNPYFIEERKYTYRDVVTGDILASVALSDDAGMAYPLLDEVNKVIVEGDATTRLDHRVQFDYDLYGNIIQSIDFGDGSAADRLVRNVQYYEMDNINYFQAIRQEVIESDAEILRMTKQEIDEFGNVYEVTELIDDNKFAITNYSYDDYGNVTLYERPENIQGQRLTYAYLYDADIFNYPIEITDAYGYRSTASYDVRHGNLVHQTDINQQTVRMTYDAKGRMESITGPMDTLQALVRFEYFTDEIPAYGTTKRYDPAYEMDLLAATFMDGFVRPIETQKMGVLASPSGTTSDVMLISESEKFDAFGRIVTSYYPTSRAGWTIDFQSVPVVGQPTQMTWDILDRPIAVTLPDGRQSSYRYTLEQNNLGQLNRVTTRVDAKGQTSKIFADQIGRERAKLRFSDNGELWTNYEYNPLAENTKIVDTEDNEIIYKYDKLGRNIRIDHPDGGARIYTFDPAGNLIHKSTSKLQADAANDGVVEYKHDYERLIEINYPKNYQNKVQLHYGDADAEYNRVGRVWLREDASGGEEMHFGALGEITKSIRTVLVHRNNMQTFVSEFNYDSWGRTQSMTYPDGEQVSFGYDRAGFLSSMQGNKSGLTYNYLKTVGYDRFQEPIYIEYGNGVKTNREYDDVRRSLSTINLNNESTSLGNIAYQYDAVDNVSHYDIDCTDNSYGIGGGAKHTYRYDMLARLTEAYGSYDGAQNQIYRSSLAYDDAHNISANVYEQFENDQLVVERSYENQFEYQGNRPHAPSAMSGRTFNYDASGNLMNRRGVTAFDFKQFVWDEENRLRAISNNGYISKFTYDGFGERVISSHGGIQGIFIDGEATGIIDHVDNYTISVSPFFTKTADAFIKHYYFDGQRFLTKLGNGKFRFDAIQRGELATAGMLDYQGRRRQLEAAQDEYYRALGIPPGAPTLLGLAAQPEFTGNGLPSELNSDYNQIPPGWPIATANEDTTGAPGHPVIFETVHDSVMALSPGYAFDSTGTAIYPEIDLHYLHQDHIGSVAFVTDINGDVIEFNIYTPHGNIFVSESTSERINPFKFNGKVYDEQTGLHYFGARYFDSKMGLWVNIDPFVNTFPDYSPYAFTFHNPVSYVDSDGKLPGRLYLSTDAAAKAFITEFNPVSIQMNREFAAAIYYDPVGGYYSFTKPSLGTVDGVTIPDVPFRTKMVGDVHTHGAYHRRFSSDVFSPDDIEGIESFGHVGYLGTPRGKALRFDPNDGPDGKITTLSRTIPADPNHPKVKKSKRHQKRFRRRTASPKTRKASLHLGKRSAARY